MSASRLRHNVIYNLLGSLVPILVMMVTIPIYLSVVGTARFGVLSLIWLVVGYFGLLDFGLSRATAQRLSRMRDEALETRTTVFYTAGSLNFVLGIGAALLFLLASHPISAFLDKSSGLHDEILASIPIVAVFLPFGLLGGVLVGCLEANERFREINIQQAVGSVLLQVLPIVFFQHLGGGLPAAVLGVITARLFNVAWLAVVCLRWAAPAGRPRIDRKYVGELFGYGGWVTLSNVVAPLLAGIDQLIIGAMLGAKSVAHYAVPYSMSAKVLFLPEALTRALFPRLASASAEEALDLSRRAAVVVSNGMAAICIPGILLVPFILTIWVGAEFARDSHLTASLLLAGIWVNSVALIPFILLLARGRPDVVAKLYAIEVAPFLLLLYGMILWLGLPGAALAWCARMSFDAGLMLWAGKFSLRDVRLFLPPGAGVIAAALIAVVVQPGPLVSLVASVALVGGLALWMYWRRDDFSDLFSVLRLPAWLNRALGRLRS